MRKAFAKTLSKLAKKDKSIYFLTAGLSFSYFDELKEVLGDRFIDVGICEQSLVGIASGLALSGMKPYCYSIANFLVFRAFEQIRNDVAYHNTDVKLIGFGGEDAYHNMGYTHNLFNEEDREILSVLPNIEIYVPLSKIGVKKVIELTYQNNKPTYIRLGRL